MTINILKGAYSTETTISTQLPDGQDSRCLISFASTTRIKPNLHWESSFEVRGFEDWIEMLARLSFRRQNGDVILFYVPRVNDFLAFSSVASSTCVQEDFLNINWSFAL
jgi:hypothetical protein